MKKSLFITFFVLFTLQKGLFGAEITVPLMEVASRGIVADGDFRLQSSIAVDFSVTGGYKYGMTLGLGAEIPNLEKALSNGRMDIVQIMQTDIEEFDDRFNNQTAISIRSVNVTVREIFNSPLDITFFIGRFDKLGSGDEFQELFGTDPLGTTLKGFFYYPEGLNGDPFLRYNGAIHNIMGTGLKLRGIFGNFVPILYIYNDLSFPKSQGYNQTRGNYYTGHYSGDIKLLVNTEHAKFEIFAGSTFIKGDTIKNDNPVFRTGVMAWFGTDLLSLLMQAGIPHWQTGMNMTIDNCYFLLEPRFRHEKFGVNLTLFYNPAWYQNKIICDKNNLSEHGRMDINLRAFYGNLTKSSFETGIETTLNLKGENRDDLKLWVSPFVSVATSGLLWDFMVRVNPRYPIKKDTLMECFIGVRTAY